MVKKILKKQGEKKENEKANKFFGEAPIWKVIITMAIPSAVMMVSFGSYFFFDSVLSINLANDSYVNAETGKILSEYYIPGLSSTALVRIFMNGYSAINSLMVAITLLMGIGISTRVAINMGRGDLERAKNTLRTGFMVALGMAFVLIPILLIAAKPWIGLQYKSYPMGALNIIKNEAFRYALPIISTYPIYMFGNMTSSLFRVEARNKQMLVTMISPIFLNLFLDWVMMGPAGLGVEGGAWATVSANCFTALLAALFILRSSKNSLLRFPILFGFKFHIIAIVGILLVGLAPFSRNIAQSVNATVQTNITNQVSGQVFFDNYLIDWQKLSSDELREMVTQNLQGIQNQFDQKFKWDALVSVFGTENVESMANQISDILTKNWNQFTNPEVQESYNSILQNADSWNGLTQQQLTYGIFMYNGTLKFRAAPTMGIIGQQAASAMISIMSGSMPIFILFFPVMYSFAQAARPVAAYNYGHKNYHRVKQTYVWTMIYAFISAVLIYFVVAWGLSSPLIDLLKVQNDPYFLASKDLAMNALKITMLAMIFYSFAIGGMVLFGSTDRIVISIIASSLQGLILFWPAIYGMREAALVNLDNDLLFLWFWPISAAAASIIIVLMSIRTLITLKKHEQITLDERIEKIYVWRDKIKAKRKAKKAKPN